jgi:hypothetical protein
MANQPSEPKYRAPLKKSLQKFVASLEELKVFASNNDLEEADVTYVTELLSEQTKVASRAIRTKRSKVTIEFPGASAPNSKVELGDKVDKSTLDNKPDLDHKVSKPVHSGSDVNQYK